jgi:hypothetical protein
VRCGEPGLLAKSKPFHRSGGVPRAKAPRSGGEECLGAETGTVDRRSAIPPFASRRDRPPSRKDEEELSTKDANPRGRRGGPPGGGVPSVRRVASVGNCPCLSRDPSCPSSASWNPIEWFRRKTCGPGRIQGRRQGPNRRRQPRPHTESAGRRRRLNGCSERTSAVEQKACTPALLKGDGVSLVDTRERAGRRISPPAGLQRDSGRQDHSARITR